MIARCLLAVLLTYVSYAQPHSPGAPSGASAIRTLVRPGIPPPAPEKPFLQSPQPDTIRLLAILVDFQRDTDTLTTGDGKFQLQPSPSRMIDPPPHDSSYFADKLLFLSNYYRKVSKGKVNIRGHVVGRVITLSKQMSAYSPPKDGSNNRPLAELVLEAWRLADSLHPGFPFADFHAFALFHAGTGRDVDLVSILGYDPTPRDIPSITLTLRTLREYLQDPSYRGIPVSGGSFFITHTMLLPETESRPIGRTDTLQLSINGLLAASFGTYLGLPDLFDTKTGRSGIGRFGLMDGAAIGAYGGLFPPHPSAWEKIYLGWARPVIVSSTRQIELPAVGSKEAEDRIYKVPINDREYFLLENRIRDPQSNGQRLTVRDGSGALREYFFSKDTTGFRFDDVRAISGSVIDVEDFDWALPGLAGAEQEFQGGGILIWHIDEDVIGKGLATNTVNADPGRRGVDLEEADGSKDIGRTYDLLERGFGTELGWPLDFWFKGNPSVPYKNVFHDTSTPNSRSNTGSRSLITIRDISPRADTMTAMVEIGDDRLRPLPGFPIRIEGDITTSPIPFDLDGDGIDEVVVGRVLFSGQDGRGGSPVGRGAVTAWRQTGVPFLGSSSIVAEVDVPSLYSVALMRHPQEGNVYLTAAAADGVYLWKLSATSGTTMAERIFKVPTNQIFVMFADTAVVAFEGSSGVQYISLRGAVSTVPGTEGRWWTVAQFGPGSRLVMATYGIIQIHDVSTGSFDRFPSPSGTVEYLVSGDLNGTGKTEAIAFITHVVWDQAGGRETYKKTMAVIDPDRVSFVSLDGENVLADPNESFLTPPVLADIDGDGKKEIFVISNRGRLFGFNSSGRLAEGFPVQLGTAHRYVRSGLVVGDSDGDGRPDILNVDSRGDLWTYRPGIKRSADLVARVSNPTLLTPALFKAESGLLGLAGVDPFGQIVALSFSAGYTPGSVQWPMFKQNPAQSSLTLHQVVDPRPLSREFLARDRTYNWPNPVYGSTTQIRFHTTEDAAISIKIFDLAGATIAELTGRAQAGVDGEVLWDVSGIQSGVYLARVEARGTSRSEVAVIKIAVVR